MTQLMMSPFAVSTLLPSVYLITLMITRFSPCSAITVAQTSPSSIGTHPQGTESSLGDIQNKTLIPPVARLLAATSTSPSCTGSTAGTPSCNFDHGFCSFLLVSEADNVDALQWTLSDGSRGPVSQDWQPGSASGSYIYLDVSDPSVPVNTRAMIIGQVGIGISAVCIEFHYATTDDQAHNIRIYTQESETFDEHSRILIGELRNVSTGGQWQMARFSDCPIASSTNHVLIAFESEKISATSTVGLDYIKITGSTVTPTANTATITTPTTCTIDTPTTSTTKTTTITTTPTTTTTTSTTTTTTPTTTTTTPTTTTTTPTTTTTTTTPTTTTTTPTTTTTRSTTTTTPPTTTTTTTPTTITTTTTSTTTTTTTTTTSNRTPATASTTATITIERITTVENQQVSCVS